MLLRWAVGPVSILDYLASEGHTRRRNLKQSPTVPANKVKILRSRGHCTPYIRWKHMESSSGGRQRSSPLLSRDTANAGINPNASKTSISSGSEVQSALYQPIYPISHSTHHRHPSPLSSSTPSRRQRNPGTRHSNHIWMAKSHRARSPASPSPSDRAER